ncbi:hypothetical protein QBC38DRAFT_474089 [Podospora fimiseda]|uniref:Berberine/berberine-like domain-containing protein n=1 Tax=Podospora fimiseda TaxID=252190 RepID=A0AAN7BSS9_9PEZI|nr:hypothetical protein QBC38DRAFT_474089 [Podospora fimiseda]
MGCDTLLEATLVTADGNKVAVTSKDDQKSDNGKLFWALCGAGGGNFGVVVEMKMKLQKLEGREVVAGLYVWAPKPDADAMKNFMSTMVDFYTAKWPTQTTIDSSWLCALDDAKSELKVRFPIYHNGDKAKFDATIDKHIKNRELAKQLKLRSAAEPSTRFLLETLVSQWSFENKSTLSSATGKFRIYTSVALDNNKTTIVGVTNLIRKEMAVFRDRFTGEDGLMQVTWIHAGGRANRGKNSTTTAFPWRTCVYHTYVMLEWKEKWLNADMEGFLKRMRTELRKFAIESRASFINFPDRGLKKGYEEAYFGVNTEALREIKEKWDPDNFFKWSQGVKLPKKSNNKPPRIMRAAPRIAPGEEGDAVATFSVFVVDRAVDEGKSEEEEEEQEKDEYIVDDMVLGAAAVRNKYEGGGVLSLLDLGF